MKRTISFMTGKGSVNHNSRKFHAKNTDPKRSCLNVEYCNENVKDVYHELFDEALTRYNEKQTRCDRRIDDYYEKIRPGKQEKPFHEIILQIGDKDNMGAKTENGRLAAKVLDKYMRDFQRRNPTLRVFSAYLHMDEATPHLHIDFVPYTTGSKRGLDTRVSLKQALFALGFKGGTRQETELNQWVAYEKEQLAAVTDMTLRTVTLGHVQRGGSPSLRDRLLAARFGVKAIECLIAGKKAVAVGVRNEEIVADDLQKALAYPAADRSELFKVCEILCR